MKSFKQHITEAKKDDWQLHRREDLPGEHYRVHKNGKDVGRISKGDEIHPVTRKRSTIWNVEHSNGKRSHHSKTLNMALKHIKKFDSGEM